MQAGNRVTGIARSEAKAVQLGRQGATAVKVSIFVRAALTEALRGNDAVKNLATAIPPTAKFMLKRAWLENDRIRTEGSAAIVDAALAAGVPRLIQELVSMLYCDQGDKWIDENSPTDQFPMAVGNHAAEANARRFSASKGTGVVLRFGWFCGPGAAHSEEFFALSRRGLCLMMRPPGSFVSTIHLADAGAAVSAALSVPLGTYNVVDEEPLTKMAFADALATAAQRTTYLRGSGTAGVAAWEPNDLIDTITESQ